MDRGNKIESAVKILRDKAESLGRLPKKADLSESELCFVKGVLGPFPRALERAGLKDPPDRKRSRMKGKR